MSKTEHELIPEQDGIVLTRERLAALLTLEEDEDFTRPTRHAYAAASALLAEVGARVYAAGHIFPDALLTTTEKGGINWYWTKPNFSVQLTLASAPDGTDYIYVRDRGKSSMHEASAAHLVGWLQEYAKHPG